MPNDERRPSRRKDGLRGEAVDLLYQKECEAYGAEFQEKEAIYKKALQAKEKCKNDIVAVFFRLLDRAVPGGEIDLGLQKCLEEDDSDSNAILDTQRAASLAKLGEFYDRLTPSQRPLFAMLVASLQPGVGLYVGYDLDNRPELCAVGPGADARGALPAQQRREGRAS